MVYIRSYFVKIIFQLFPYLQKNYNTLMSAQLITDNRLVFQSPKTIVLDTTSSRFAKLHISNDNNGM